MIFPKDFFNEEKRNDFIVSEMMKRAWAAQIEVLEVVDKICKKNNLTWFADGGTLLGAIRHKGFIPWDDDIDIALLRSDYNSLIEILPSELPRGFSIAGMYAKEKRLQDAAKVQQLRVIADEKYWDIASYMSRFHGFPCYRVGIDIFPLDYVYKDENKDKEIMNTYSRIVNILTNWNEYLKRSDFKEILESLEGLETKGRIVINDDLYNSLWRLSDELISSIPGEKSDFVTNYFYRCYYMINSKGDYAVDKNAYSKVINKPFEFFEVPVPELYDKVLKTEFGDYSKFVKSYDTHSYPFYKFQLEGFEQMLRQTNIQISVEEFCKNWIDAIEP